MRQNEAIFMIVMQGFGIKITDNSSNSRQIKLRKMFCDLQLLLQKLFKQNNVILCFKKILYLRIIGAKSCVK
jgi:hypothetical protein